VIVDLKPPSISAFADAPSAVLCLSTAFALWLLLAVLGKVQLFELEVSWESVRMKRRILLVDDEISILLTLKAVLEISGFDVDTATSAREAKLRIKQSQYDMVITDLRMETDAAGADVIAAARTAKYRPAVALLSAYPVTEDDWHQMGAGQMLVKPLQTHHLLTQIEALLLARKDGANHPAGKTAPKKKSAAKPIKAKTTKPVTKVAAKKVATKKVAAKKVAAKKVAAKPAVRPAKKIVAAKKAAKPAPRKPAAKKSSVRTAAKAAATSKNSRKR
jgi:CheY-like chemotaxis protein